MKAQEFSECCVCGNKFPEDMLISGYGIRKELEALILAECPAWNDKCRICMTDFNRIRRNYMLTLVQEEQGRIEKLEREVVDSIHESEMLSRNTNIAVEEKSSAGEKLSDRIARFGGSWTFIIIFLAILFTWIAINSLAMLFAPFDPYPYILMNLILSCIAAIQAPIIMMSQNRQETKDRARAENDYQVNLKAEIEIRTLHEKMDHLLLDQWSRMMEVQELQIDMLGDIAREIRK
jgi:uncharacterized membrane protein